MEVHKHPHHPTHKKNWGEYFLEFLMLFLAVFLGFIAENIREHTVEHKKARQYAVTMLEDLKADEEALHDGIMNNKLIMAKLDTLLTIYEPGNAHTSGQFYYYGQYGFRFWHYVNKQVTLEQMKNSGTIGYFQNSHLENQMVRLDKAISFVKYHDDLESLLSEPAIKYATTLFDYSVLESIPGRNIRRRPSFNENQQQTLQNFLQSSPPVSKAQLSLTQEYLNFCNLRVNRLSQKISVYQSALSEIQNLDAELRKEFNIK